MVKTIKFFIPLFVALSLCFILWQGLGRDPQAIFSNTNVDSLNINSLTAQNNSSGKIYSFKNSNQENLFKLLTQELRCIVCQNQNLAESQAEVALQLRNNIYQEVLLGKNKNEILESLSSQYGEFILYNPPFHAGTLILWLGPLFLLIMGLYLFFRFINKSSKSSKASELHL